jgi:hypothetical protein
MLFILSMAIQVSFLEIEDSYPPFIVSVFLNVPLLSGFLLGYVFQVQQFAQLFRLRFGKNDIFPIIFILVCHVLLLLAAILLSMTSDLIYLIAYTLNFISGFLISNALNQENPSAVSRRASWLHFFLWCFIGGLCGLPLILLPLLFVRMVLPVFVQVIPLVVGILIGIRKGRISELLKQPKPFYKVMYGPNEKGVFNRRVRTPINWVKFVRGFVIGLTIFGLYSSYGPLPLNLIAIYYFMVSGLVSAIPIALMLGSIYGFGPFVLAKVMSLPDYRLGQIGVFLTITGIILLALPSFN